ncbi:MAG: hypothetical protein KDB86_04545 [Actinobacteria bacterium]|nr:hypothetical protein [Actinomycetota bacterium]MCB9388257.1 hypothetical protein [Acidimicrobiia bacterium]
MRTLLTGLVMLAAIAAIPTGAGAVPTLTISDEVASTNTSCSDPSSSIRDLAELTDDAWRADVNAGGYTEIAVGVVPDPAGSSDTPTNVPATVVFPGSSVTASVWKKDITPTERDSLSPASWGTDDSPTYRDPYYPTSASLQDCAPRPSSLYDTAGQPRYWNAVGGDGANLDAAFFAFSEPVAAFGAWFGDVETRTDGQGVTAYVKLFDVDGNVLSLTPIPTSTPDQSLCGGPQSSDYIGCGNQSTRWIGFQSSNAEVAYMMVVVGEDDSCDLYPSDCDGNTEHLSWIGPTLAVAPVVTTTTTVTAPTTTTTAVEPTTTTTAPTTTTTAVEPTTTTTAPTTTTTAVEPTTTTTAPTTTTTAVEPTTTTTASDAPTTTTTVAPTTTTADLGATTTTAPDAPTTSTTAIEPTTTTAPDTTTTSSPLGTTTTTATANTTSTVPTTSSTTAPTSSTTSPTSTAATTSETATSTTLVSPTTQAVSEGSPPTNPLGSATPVAPIQSPGVPPFAVVSGMTIDVTNGPTSAASQTGTSHLGHQLGQALTGTPSQVVGSQVVGSQAALETARTRRLAHTGNGRGTLVMLVGVAGLLLSLGSAMMFLDSRRR